MQPRRSERVVEQLREELAELIENEVADPRVGMVNVTRVQLSSDGKQALVLITPVERKKEETACLRGLESAKGFLRRELAGRLQLRHTPELRFAIDHGPSNVQRVETLLDRIHKRSRKPLALLLLCGSAGLLRGETLRYESSAYAMGSTFTIAAYGEDRAQLAAGVEAAFQEVRRIDHFLSNYIAASELSEVNRDGHRKAVLVSPEFFRLAEKCQEYSRLSEGAFDWTVGPLMRVWGFYRDSGRLPAKDEIAQALGKVGYQHVQLDPGERTVRFARDGMELDPGGIGKGYAVDRMVEVLRESGVQTALLSAAGSSIFGLGGPPGEPRGWRIRIRDPKSEAVTVDEIYLKDMSLSTSGAYEKFFEAEGKIYSHIMDPRTGYPAQGVVAASVLAPRTLDSEAWTKPVFINGGEWTRQHLPAGLRAFLCEAGKPCFWVP
jgi:thiamine biosynthesis lipoprotein